MKTFKDHILSTEDLPMELKEEIYRIIEKEHEDVRFKYAYKRRTN